MKKPLEDLSVEEFKQFSDVISDDVYAPLQIESILQKRDIKGGTAPAQNALEIAAFKDLLAKR